MYNMYKTKVINRNGNKYETITTKDSFGKRVIKLKNGNQHGTFEHTRGSWVSKGHYKDGKRHGLFYYKSPYIEISSYYKDNKLHGNYVKKIDGKIIEASKYKNDQLIEVELNEPLFKISKTKFINGVSTKKVEVICDNKRFFGKIVSLDGSLGLLNKQRKINNFIIYSVFDFGSYENEYAVYSIENNCYSHGCTIKKAFSDLEYKIMKREGVQSVVNEIKKSGVVTPLQYRIITGACSHGINKFLTKNGLTDVKSIDLEKAIEITHGEYGHENFVKLFQ